MFKRKENIVHQTDQSLPMQSSAYLPDENERAEKSDIDNTTSLALPEVSDTTTIPETCLIVGEISAVGDIHINGTVNGIINSDKTVFVQKNGRVDGEVHAKRIEISGKITGIFRSLELAVNACGHLDGTIECESLSVNQHGRFYGHSKPYESKPQETENKAEQKITAPLVTLSHDFQFGEQTLM